MIPKLFPFVFAGLLAMASADELTFSSDLARLTGDVQAIDPEGNVLLSSKLSPEPLSLKGDVVKKVTFSSMGKAPESLSALVGLINGDELAANIEGMDESGLSISSPEFVPESGVLKIPRDSVAFIRLGIQKAKVIYAGPKGMEEWSGSNFNFRKMTSEGGNLVASGSATASKNIEQLPEQFILRFTMHWEESQQANFQVNFADPLKSKDASDRYFMRFSSAGLDIQRETAARGKRFHNMVFLERKPDQYTDNKLKVELRVDRKTRRIKLLLDGVTEREWQDPLSIAPTGSGIMFTFAAKNEISDIEVVEYDKDRVDFRPENEPRNSKKDRIATREDSGYPGSLLGIQKEGNALNFKFKNEYEDKPMDIPEEAVTGVFLRNGATHKSTEGSFSLHLRGEEGKLKVSACRFEKDRVFAEHALLGAIQLRRESMISLERVASNFQPESKP